MLLASVPRTRTQVLTALFKDKGYTVIEKWECVFNTELKTDPEMRAYFEAHPTTRTPPLILRHALVGGRTSALRWYHKADLDRGEKIKMVDVVSEYPNANLRGDYPYGHRNIYLEGNPDMPDPDQWNGMIKCTVLPPRDLFIPVLLYKANGKLMFPLCRTCVEIQNSERRHDHEDPRERQLTSTCRAPELLLALREKSYELITVHEVHQYPGTVAHNPETGEDGLLSGYVRCFMALKMQASGWPPECDSDDKKEQFIKDTLKHDVVVLDPAKMVKNSALRTMAKLMCNSFWGKFGEKTLRSRIDLIYDPAKLMPLLTDPRKEVTGLLPLSKECIQVTWKPVEDSETYLPTSSILHAAFTTCFGRLQLYKYLDVVKERALFHDTDSVAYISRPGEPDLPIGTHLGDLTDQVEGDYGPGLLSLSLWPADQKITLTRWLWVEIPPTSKFASSHGDGKHRKAHGAHSTPNSPSSRVENSDTIDQKIWQAVSTKRRRLCVERTVPFGYNAWTMAPEEDQDHLEVMDLLADAWEVGNAQGRSRLAPPAQGRRWLGPIPIKRQKHRG
ncbi:DNA polymerase [Frankliniella fusca]|uniref:DNA polymerase n=1 Tax=Frankliniella fusca TaxID=407009 RepID=A0AAE1HE92_9NEOP|nr:DNA polymerase [Frankliniella fusca]